MSITQTVDTTETASDPHHSASVHEQAIMRISSRLENTVATSFLDDYALGMCEELGADYFIIGRLNPYSNMMRTLRFASNGKLLDNLVYSIDGTPCADTLNDGICIFPNCVADHYPHDKDLRDLEIAAYAGVSLRSDSSADLGVLVGMWKRPIQDTDDISKLLSHFSRRVASVIETTETAARYSWAVSNVFCGVWDWDLRTGGAFLSEGLLRILGSNRNGKGSYDLSKLEDAIHPEDRPKHVEAIKQHLNNGLPYDMALRLRGENGVYRWYVSRGSATRDNKGRPERMIGGFCDIHDIIVALEKTPRD